MLPGALFECASARVGTTFQPFEGRVRSEEAKAAGHPNGDPNDMTIGFDRKTVSHGTLPEAVDELLPSRSELMLGEGEVSRSYAEQAARRRMIVSLRRTRSGA